MIGISRQTDYAARIVLHLACLPAGTQVPIRQIAEQRQLPVPFVRRLVALLVGKGILQSSRGSAGGVQLGKPAQRITLLDLVRAMEGPIALNQCVDNDQACPFAGTCPVQMAWTGASRALEEHLATVDFAALAHGSQGHMEAHAALQPETEPNPCH